MAESLGLDGTKARPGPYREILAVAVPLILSTSSISVMHVIDRMFLSWYSSDALAAAMQAGSTSFLFISLFLGTAGYVSTFVSQYDGAGRRERIGAAIWQGIYFSAIATVVMAAVSLLAGPIFRSVGHPAAMVKYEIPYFRILAFGGGGTVFGAALSSFYSGRGKTWTVMWVNFTSLAVNAVLDYCWIFGKGPLPAWGIAGAAWATVTAKWMEVGIYGVLLFGGRYRREYAMAAAWRLDRDLFGRLLRYGLPTGFHFMADMVAITVFILLVGRAGAVEAAATTVAFTVNMLVFMPMVGMAIATSVLVGRYIGAGHPDRAATITWSALRIALLYTSGFAAALVAWPDVFVAVFRPREGAGDFAAIAGIARYLLYFVAAYSTLDGANIIFSAALKGAGDTRFVLWGLVVVAVVVLVGPLLGARAVFGLGFYGAWTILSVYVAVLAGVYWLRFRQGRWRSMRVIEHAPAPVAAISEGPLVEA
jgi:MATE family multidrug resistance protein